MNNFRNRPKGEYIHEAAWQDLYVLTERWQNNLEFQLFEIEFLENLIETYFIKLLHQQNLDELRELQRDLYRVKNQCKALLHRINTHLNQIADILDNPFKYDGSIFRVEHERLEDDISEFIIDSKVVRHIVFKMSKEVLESEKPKFIL